jgi:hypothetical protein
VGSGGKVALSHRAMSMSVGCYVCCTLSRNPRELRSRDVTVVSLSPGWTCTETIDCLPARVLRKLPSRKYVGRRVVHLALNPRRHEKSGPEIELGALAREYGFRNLDGRLIDYYAEVARHPTPGVPPD